MKPKAISWLSILLFAACIDRYPIEVLPTDKDYLVINGFINSGEGPTTFKLSHLLSIEDPGEARPELGAQVIVESSTGEAYPLTERGGGEYSEEHPTDTDKQYRLHIQTTEGKEYLSEFVEVKHTPPIDSITWDLNREFRELSIYVTTHDTSNKARYYQWEYVETYQYQSSYLTKLEYRNGEIIYDPYLDIYNCWKTINSTRLLSTSTTKLSEDAVYKFPITYITPEDEKVRLLYGINIKQYALTAEAYLYLELLKKFTELNGSIFDPVPSRFQGNIYCISNPEEPAVGYLSAYNVEEKRIFISDDKLPAWFYELSSECPEENGLGAIITRPSNVPGYLSRGYIAPVGTIPDLYTYHIKTCVDCRMHKAPHDGGTNIKPDFWPE